MLRERLERVEERIEAAARRAGRAREEITLVAVTKKFDAAVIREAYDAGLRRFGENYVQEFEAKYPALADLKDAEFHLIGHLQSNKAKVAGELFQVIQTVDSEKLAKRLDQGGRVLEVMIEVKLSEEETKVGAAPETLAGLIEGIRGCANLRLTGLMTMPPWCEDPEVTRPYFRRLAALAREFGLAKLSMGMSHDLEAAIEEGATHVRGGDGFVWGEEDGVGAGGGVQLRRRLQACPTWAASLPHLGCKPGSLCLGDQPLAKYRAAARSSSGFGHDGAAAFVAADGVAGYCRCRRDSRRAVRCGLRAGTACGDIRRCRARLGCCGLAPRGRRSGRSCCASTAST